MTKAAPKKVAVGAWVEERLDAAIRKIAKAKGRTRSKVIEDAIQKYVIDHILSTKRKNAA